MDTGTANTSGNGRRKPCGTGRRKVEIKKIESASSRMVAFSKRKKGLFNKAGELHRLCAATVAVIIFSSTGRPFAFGKPSVDHVIDRFLGDGGGGAGGSCSEGIKDTTEDEEEEEEEEEESRDMQKIGNSEDENEEEEDEGGGGGFWWEESVEGLSLEETEKFKDSLEAIRNNVAMRSEEIVMRRDCERNFLSSIR